MVFHPEIQKILEDVIILIRSGEIDDGINKLVGLIDFSNDEYRVKVETAPEKWELKTRFIAYDWFWACIGMIIKKVTSDDGRIKYYEIMKHIMGSWMLNSFRDGCISKETYEKFVKAVGT